MFIFMVDSFVVFYDWGCRVILRVFCNISKDFDHHVREILFADFGVNSYKEYLEPNSSITKLLKRIFPNISCLSTVHIFNSLCLDNR